MVFENSLKIKDLVSSFRGWNTRKINSEREYEHIIERVKLYFSGTYYGDVAQLQGAFHPDAHITGVFNETTCDWTLAQFIDRVTTAPTAADKGEKFDKEIISIDVTNNAALVKARVVAGDNCFTDYITLLKIDGEWVIRNKSFTL